MNLQHATTDIDGPQGCCVLQEVWHDSFKTSCSNLCTLLLISSNLSHTFQIQGEPHFRQDPCLQQSIHPAKFAIFISHMDENCVPKMTGKLTFSGVDDTDQSYMADPTTDTTSHRLHPRSHGLTQAALGSTFHCANHTTAPSPLTTVSSTTSSPFRPHNSCSCSPLSLSAP